MKNLLQSFFWGVISACMALILQIFSIIFFPDLNNSNFLQKHLVFVMLLFVFWEESVKYLIALFKIIPLSVNPKSIVFNSLFAGIGFATIETTILWQKELSENFFPSNADLTGIILIHILTFTLIGQGLILFNKKSPFLKLPFIITPPIILHLAYNLCAIYLSQIHFVLSARLSVIAILIIFNFVYFTIIVNKGFPQQVDGY